MSYHESYEFFAIDRCLTVSQMRALRRISTRATITPNRFFNWYDWGGLKGSPREMLARYFDLFVHTGNGIPDWGMLRLPSGAITRSHWRPYVAILRGHATTSLAAGDCPSWTCCIRRSSILRLRHAPLDSCSNGPGRVSATATAGRCARAGAALDVRENEAVAEAAERGARSPH